MEHCRGSLVREGGSLESYWCPAPQEFKSLPRRNFFKIKNPIGLLLRIIIVFMWLNLQRIRWIF
jgi:hypothetical protein